MTDGASSAARKGMTLETFIMEGMLGAPSATGAFTSLLNQISFAAKLVTSQVRRAGLANVLGYTGEVNVQGEQVMKLDELANETLVTTLARRGHCAAIASEELDDIHLITNDKRARYVVMFDPLDGSSNIDVNVSIGTIFSVLRKVGHAPGVSEEDFLQPGKFQAAAGYCVYGPQTTLVLTVGNGVAMFTLDREMGSWVLTGENLRIPEDTQEFAINMSNLRHWAPPMKRYINECLAGMGGPLGKDFNMRWVGSMVADVHRILSRGGIFMYPWDAREPDKPGKLRLMYEANPMAFLVEQAGGAATDGSQRIMDLMPTKLHQRVSVFLGSKNEVERVTGYHRAA